MLIKPDEVSNDQKSRHRNSPFLKIALRPGFVKPVTRVVDSSIGLLCDGIITGADLLEKRVTLVWLRNRNVMVIGKSFETRIAPAVNL